MIRGRRAGAALLAVVALAVAGCGSSGGGSDKGKQLRVGLFGIAQVSVVSDGLNGFRTELQRRLPGYSISFDAQNAQGDPSLIQSIARYYAHSNDNLIAVIGTPAVIALAQLDKTTPIIAIAMGDPVGAKVASSLEAPGGNVTGSTDYIPPSQQLGIIDQVKPAARRIGTIYDPSNENSQIWIKALEQARPDVVAVPVGSSGDIPAATRSLAGRVDAILIGPDATVSTGYPAVAAVARQNKIALYLTGGDQSINGVLASIGANYAQLGQLAAGNAARIVQGASPGKLSFQTPPKVTVSVNRATARALGVTMPASFRGS
jgi:putative ABC transport system substrate-binding protein